MNDMTLPGLIVPIEGRVDRLEKALKRAADMQARQAGQMERRARQSAANMASTYDKMGARMSKAFGALAPVAGGIAGGFLGGFAVGGVAEIARSVGDVARGIAEVGDQAKRAGVPLKDFQELAFVAQQNRIEVDALTDGLKEMNLRADEFILTGKGSSAEAFARLGYTADDLKEKLKNPSELLVEIVGRLEKFDKAAQIRISDEIFGGTGGEQFVQLIARGEDGLRQTLTRARELGVAMDDELVAKAERVNQRFNEISTTVGVTLKSAIVSAADSLAEFLDGFRAFQNQQSTTLQARQTEIMRERAQLLERLDASDLKGRNRERLEATTNQRVRELTAEEDEIIGILQERTPAFTPKDRQWTPPVVPNTPTDPNADKGKADKKDDFARTVASIEEDTASRTREAETLTSTATAGRTYAEAMEFASTKAQLLAAAQRDGLAITPQLIAQIDQLASGYVRAGDRASGAADKMREIEERGKRGAQAVASIFTGMMTGATTAEEALSGLLMQMAEVQMQKLFMGASDGGAMQFIGGMLGFASGGYTGQGGKFEPAGVVHRGEFVMSKAATERLGVGNLDRLHRSALQGYSGGGLVGGTQKALAPVSGRSGASGAASETPAPSMTFAPNITVSGSAGTPEQNGDLAKRIARESEASFRRLVQDEITRQHRKGAMLNRAGR